MKRTSRCRRVMLDDTPTQNASILILSRKGVQCEPARDSSCKQWQYMVSGRSVQHNVFPMVSLWAPWLYSPRGGARLPGARITFQPENGDPLETLTDGKGEFSISLPANVNYTITVESRGLVPVHRPPFRVKPGTTLKFDFRLIIQASENFSRGEDRFHYDGNVFIVFYGSREFEDGLTSTRYGALRIIDNLLPVTLSFDVYTIRSDGAFLDQKTGVFQAKGNVLVEDGSGTPPQKASCTVVHPATPVPRIEPCQDENRTETG